MIRLLQGACRRVTADIEADAGLVPGHLQPLRRGQRFAPGAPGPPHPAIEPVGEPPEPRLAGDADREDPREASGSSKGLALETDRLCARTVGADDQSYSWLSCTRSRLSRWPRGRPRRAARRRRVSHPRRWGCGWPPRRGAILSGRPASGQRVAARTDGGLFGSFFGPVRGAMSSASGGGPTEAERGRIRAAWIYCRAQLASSSATAAVRPRRSKTSVT